jgi:hypothetical protein
MNWGRDCQWQFGISERMGGQKKTRIGLQRCGITLQGTIRVVMAYR